MFLAVTSALLYNLPLTGDSGGVVVLLFLFQLFSRTLRIINYDFAHIFSILLVNDYQSLN